MSIASFFCSHCGVGYHAHEAHECKTLWRVVAPDGRTWRNPRLMAAVAAAIEETKLQFPAEGSTATSGVRVTVVPPVPDGVWEALQRLIENAETLGPASREDALLVNKWRAQFVAARDGVPLIDPVRGIPSPQDMKTASGVTVPPSSTSDESKK